MLLKISTISQFAVNLQSEIITLATNHIMTSHTIFDFNYNSDIKNWEIIDDVVMGGKSLGSFIISPNGYGVFKGSISLDNNGGFSSIKYKFKRTLILDFTKIVFKIKGDGKKYQFRIKSNSEDYYSYISTFSTTGNWQEIEIILKDMFPSFRGKRIDKPNFSEAYIEELSFLIANKKKENFKLFIDKIKLI